MQILLNWCVNFVLYSLAGSLVVKGAGDFFIYEH